MKCIQSVEDPKVLVIGIALFDLQSLKIKIGSFNHESTMKRLRTLLTYEKPVSIVYDRKGMPKDII